ncbi:MAG: tRNA (adenosine(37)-N6)-dimethylallyltransferase MiaA [Candidatus Pacebacteria bacterium]|nr:tRNA (adenosine(37)-N6)-dimethylallyltransferase MiaA [Candidatus Paceibacterota bacterium]
MSIFQQKPPIIVVCGPTATGKSDLAVLLARFLIRHKKQFSIAGAEIISADSRQVYKGFNLTAGKITKKEARGIPHHLLDVASPTRTFSVAQFQKRAQNIVQRLHQKHIIPIVCGGTGLYIDTLVNGVDIPNVKADTVLRKKLEKKSTGDLFDLLLKKDPRRASTIDFHNRRRLIRALEIVITTKKPVPQLHATSPYHTLFIGIHAPKQILSERIHKRLERRIKAGMINEVSKIHRDGVSWKRLEQFGLEYKWTARLLKKDITKEEYINGLSKDIEQYTKRQMTWFSRNNTINWIEIGETKKALTLVNAFLKY